MLNETLNQLQSPHAEIRDRVANVGHTGIVAEDSANLGPRRLAKQRFQRMRRRHQRAQRSQGFAPGWVARMV